MDSRKTAVCVDFEKIVIYLVFGISALLVPVWLLLEYKRGVTSRAELEREKMAAEPRQENED
ncbi:MAG: hypothetical protein RR244_05460 [Oscillospiraceae bacterium]